jgi:hypothetical protein
MQREYFCCGCGLFHWVERYKTDPETGRVDVVHHQGCPNKECISHKDPDVLLFAVDTFGYAYFAESNSDFIDSVKWSSPEFAPEAAIEVYRQQGIRIKEEKDKADSKGDASMQVHLTDIEYHYFKLGALSVAYLSPPPVISRAHEVQCINIMNEEVIQDLGEGRILIQKQV